MTPLRRLPTLVSPPAPLLVATLLVATLWLLAAPAVAYVQARDGGGRTLLWHVPELQLEVALPAGEPGAALLRATERAATRWSAATGLDIRVRSAPDATLRLSEDGRSAVVLRSRRWCPDDPAAPCHDPSRHALTQLYTRVSVTPPGAEILEADIEINGVDFSWPASATDALDAVLLHELGHALGLDLRRVSPAGARGPRWRPRAGVPRRAHRRPVRGDVPRSARSRARWRARAERGRAAGRR